MSAKPLSIDERSLEALEWHHVQGALSARAKTPGGRRLCEALKPGTLTFDQARDQARAILELEAVSREGNLNLPLTDIPDVQETLKRISRQGAINVEDFANLVRFHKGVQALNVFLTRYAGTKRFLSQRLAGFAPLEEWARKHYILLTPQGDIADSASDDLRALRKFATDLHQKIKARLDDYLNNPKQAELMQDFYVTLRDGRYVLPIKNNFKGRVPGIIHDVSNTEQTMFIEPQEIVDWNNQLKVCEKEIENEIEKILAEVVLRTQPVVPELKHNAELLHEADLLSAAALLCQNFNSPVTAFDEGELLDFVELRHPLLSLHQKVIPNTFNFDGGLILTGPNTGGKTVLLKGVGLALAMAQSGLPVNAQLFSLPRNLHSVWVDIGDDQNLEENLSTFSGHLLVLKDMLEGAQAGDLVLIDEICTGTSPEEGQPLAQAILESFLEKGVRVFVTTHYGTLKTFAMNNTQLRIAAMSFDRKTNRPSFEILMDIPGNSSAFETAEQLGLGAPILQRARHLQGDVSEDLTKAVSRLEIAREKFLERELQLEEREQRAQKLHALSQERVLDYEARQKQGLGEEARKVLRELSALRDELSQKVKSAGGTDLAGGATQLFTKISEGAEQVRSVVGDSARAEPSVGALGDDDIYADAVVEVEGVGMGVVLEVPKNLDARSQVTVQVGDLKTRVNRSRLLKPARDRMQSYLTQQKANTAAKERKLSLGQPVGSGMKSSSSVICDVRGRGLDDAMRRVEQSLNELVRDENAIITIIHGHGSDRLKEGIREYLQFKRDDVAFRSGSWPGEGGDGVTVVERSK